MMLFVGEECPHCQELEAYLELNPHDEITIYEIYHNTNNKALYLQKSQELSYKKGAVPLLIDGSTYREGTKQIIDYIEGSIDTNPATSISDEDSTLLNSLLTDTTNKTNSKTVGIIIVFIGLGLFGAIIALSKRKN